MANYRFTWQAVSASGDVESVCEQTIYGETLANACEYFEQYHGDIGTDENGVSIDIVSIIKETESE